MTDTLTTGSTIGILGGGQLGRMLSVAASRLGFKTHIFEPGANPPAGEVADRVTTAAYEDADALQDAMGEEYGRPEGYRDIVSVLRAAGVTCDWC